MKLNLIPLRCLLLLLAIPGAVAHALSSSFSYQGSLQDAGQPAKGNYDLQFVLQTQAGAAVAAPLQIDDVAVAAGVFTVDLEWRITSFNRAAELGLPVINGDLIREL